MYNVGVLSRAAILKVRRRVRIDVLGLLCLVLALVGAQSLGFMHRVVHGGLSPTVAAPAVSASLLFASATPDGGAAQTAPARSSGSALAGLFFGHDGKSTCPLFDGLTSPAIAPTLALVVAAVVLPNEQLRTFAADFVARWAALFDARGPPDFR